MSSSYKPARKRRSVALPVVIAGGLSSLLLAFSLTPTFSALTAAITNTTNTAALGTLIMKETSGSSTCLSTDGGTLYTNSANCTTINKYGGTTTPLAPGGSNTTSVTITNTGTITANTFTLTPGACSQTGTVTGSATDLCSKMTVVISSGSNTLYTGSLDGLYSGGAIDLKAKLGTQAPNSPVSISFVVTVPSSLGNTYQGLGVSQALTWTFSS
jgi:hypothetical protein